MMSDWASESGHWYRRNGTPCYEIVGKNGKLRPTTLRDARELQLVPSVTSIIREAASPGLERWKRQQLLLAALTLTRGDDEPDDQWLRRIEQDSQEQGRKAADRGSAIHGAIERYVRDEAVPAEYDDWVLSAMRALDMNCGMRSHGEPGWWKEERSFAHPLGYGGRIDLHCNDWLVDIKTKDNVADGVALYDEHYMQLAAYRRGLNPGSLPRCGILFVDRDVPLSVFAPVTAEELERGLWMFDSLLLYWRWRTRYDPAWERAKEAA